MKKSNTAYYIFYDKKTGQIWSASTIKKSSSLDFIKVDFDIYEKFVSGQYQFNQYTVTGIPPSLVQVAAQGCDFKNKAFEWIIDKANNSSSLVVTWNKPSSCWNFSIAKSVKKELVDYNNTGNLVFFIILKNDLDFLVRSIQISVAELINTELITIPFTSSFEHDIDKISIASVRIFKTYGLKIIYE